MARRAGKMCVQQSIQPGGVEQIAHARAGVAQHVLNLRAQVLLEPVHDRRAEGLFGPLQGKIRHVRPHRLAQHILVALHAHRWRNGGGKAQQGRVKKRHPRLQRTGHCGLVLRQQRVTRQPRVNHQRQRRIVGIVAPAAAHNVRIGAGTIAGSMKRRAVKLAAQRIAEHHAIKRLHPQQRLIARQQRLPDTRQIGGQRANDAVALHGRVIRFQRGQHPLHRRQPAPPRRLLAQQPGNRVMMRVAAEQFIAAQPGQHHLDMPRRFLAEQQQRHRRRISVGFVVSIHITQQAVPPVLRINHPFVMIGFKMLRDAPGMFQFVIRRAHVVADGVGLDAPARFLRHQPQHRR